MVASYIVDVGFRRPHFFCSHLAELTVVLELTHPIKKMGQSAFSARASRIEISFGNYSGLPKKPQRRVLDMPIAMYISTGKYPPEIEAESWRELKLVEDNTKTWEQT